MHKVGLVYGGVYVCQTVSPLTYLENHTDKRHTLFSERELSLIAVARPPVCLSVVCNARAPYSGSCKFRQFFCGIWYLGHPLTCTENLMEIVQGNPPSGELNPKGVANIAILDLSKAISRKRYVQDRR